MSIAFDDAVAIEFYRDPDTGKTFRSGSMYVGTDGGVYSCRLLYFGGDVPKRAVGNGRFVRAWDELARGFVWQREAPDGERQTLSPRFQVPAAPTFPLDSKTARCGCGKRHRCASCGAMAWQESHGNASGECANCGRYG